MNLARLKEFRLQKKFDKELLLSTKSRLVSQKKINSVAVLTLDAISTEIDVKKEVASVLGVNNVKQYSFKPFSKLDEPSFEHFTEKDINFNGVFTQANLHSFLEQPFDLLIGYFNEPNLYLETAMLQSKATFKAGFTHVNDKLYELEIAAELKETNLFLVELKKYLQLLKKL